MPVDRPADMFDRVWEWNALARFAGDARAGATLGIVSGRRRQGKSFLLQCLCEATGGFYYEAIEATEADSLRHLGQRLAAHVGAPGRIAFDGWPAAVDALLELGRRDEPVVVVLDEFPYLAHASPSLPSIIQGALAHRGERRSASRARLILCGSALSFMGRLLAGDAPLRGRAGLDLVVPTLDYRLAARFWGLEKDPALAMRVHAVVGGTPAYRRQFVADDVPAGPEDFDAWVMRTALDPAVPLFREGRYLLSEEPDLRDKALYHSTLAAVAEGKTTRGKIAAALQRSSQDMGHPLTVLEDAGFLERREDAFRARRPTYHLVEPIIRFYHAISRPSWAQLERPGRADAVWRRAQPTFESRLLGPDFEQICRHWALRFAAPETIGALVTDVGAGVVYDKSARARLEVDVVAYARGEDEGRRVVLLGEAKWGRRLDVTDLARLRRARTLLADSGLLDPAACRLALFSGAGFSDDLRAEAGGDVLLVDLQRLYNGE